MMAEEKKTLIIRHLPSVLTNNEIDDFLKYFGAVSIKYMGNIGRLRHIAFASFPDAISAEIALHRLHQMEVLGSRITVEFSKKVNSRYHPSLLKNDSKPSEKSEAIIDKGKEKESEEVESKKKIRDSINHLSEKWGLDFPLNPKMQYMYPPPNVSILTNIANALASYPKLYVQTLHLMNKLNLPAPFGKETSTPPLEISHKTKKNEVNDQNIPSSDDESELESDEEEFKEKKRVKVQNNESAKLPKLQDIIDKFVSAQAEPAIVPTTIYEKPAPKEIHISVPEKLEIRETVTSVDITTRNFTVSLNQAESSKDFVVESVHSANTDRLFDSSGFGKITPIEKLTENEETSDQADEEWDDGEFISSKKLKAKCLSSSEMKHLNVFRNYEPGEASSRLYIKNLAKNTTDKDLHYIYGRYVDWKNEEEKIKFDIRLMKEGRMKGQAFITLPSEISAKDARSDTNGFVVHDKPMVVSFARSAKPKIMI